MTVTLIQNKYSYTNKYQIKRLIDFRKTALFYYTLEFADINGNIYKTTFDIYCTLYVDSNKYDFVYCDKNPEKFNAILKNVQNSLAIENLC